MANTIATATYAVQRTAAGAFCRLMMPFSWRINESANLDRKVARGEVVPQVLHVLIAR